MGVENAFFSAFLMLNCFETYIDAYFVYFVSNRTNFKNKMQFENLVFVIMSTREKKHLIARASLKLSLFQILGGASMS